MEHLDKLLLEIADTENTASVGMPLITMISLIKNKKNWLCIHN